MFQALLFASKTRHAGAQSGLRKEEAVQHTKIFGVRTIVESSLLFSCGEEKKKSPRSVQQKKKKI